MKLLKSSSTHYSSSIRLRTVHQFLSPDYDQDRKDKKKRLSQCRQIIIQQNVKNTIRNIPFTPRPLRSKQHRNHLYYNNLFKSARKLEKSEKECLFLLQEKHQPKATKNKNKQQKQLQSSKQNLKKYLKSIQDPYLKAKSQMISSKKQNKENKENLHKRQRQSHNTNNKMEMKCMPSSLTCLIMNHCQVQLNNLQTNEECFQKKFINKKKPSEYSQWINILCELQQVSSFDYPTSGKHNPQIQSFQDNPYELFTNFKQRKSSNKLSSIDLEYIF